jgi:hypothetical protein
MEGGEFIEHHQRFLTTNGAARNDLIARLITLATGARN